MARITAPAFVVGLVNELCVWYDNEHAGNPLSYPVKAAAFSSSGGGKRPPGPIVPLTGLPERLKPVDRALGDMPEDMRLAVLCRHLATYIEYHRLTGNSRSTYYNQQNAGYWFIAGLLNGNLQPA